MNKGFKVFLVLLFFIIIIALAASIFIWVKNINAGEKNVTIQKISGCNQTVGCDFTTQACNMTSKTCYNTLPQKVNKWRLAFIILFAFVIVGALVYFLLQSKRLKRPYTLDEIVKMAVPWLIEKRGEHLEDNVGSVIGHHPYYEGESIEFPRMYILFWRKRKNPNTIYPDGWVPPRYECVGIDFDCYAPLDKPSRQNKVLYIEEYQKHLADMKYGRLAGSTSPVKVKSPWESEQMEVAEEVKKQMLKETMEGRQ